MGSRLLVDVHRNLIIALAMSKVRVHQILLTNTTLTQTRVYNIVYKVFQSVQINVL